MAGRIKLQPQHIAGGVFTNRYLADLCSIVCGTSEERDTFLSCRDGGRYKVFYQKFQELLSSQVDLFIKPNLISPYI